MSGRTSQRRGRRAELELARLLRAAGLPAEPGPPVSFGVRPDVVGVNGAHIEVKNVQHLDLPAALRQAAEDAAYFNDGLPCVFHRHRGGRWVVSMELKAWLALYGAGNGPQQRLDHEVIKSHGEEEGKA